MGHFARDHQATNMISLLLLAGAVAAHPYYYMPYAGLQGRAEPNVDEATARYLINFGVFQMATATAAAVGTSGVSGTVRIFQNPFISNDESRYTIEIVGLATGTNYWVCLLPTNVQTSTTPVITDFVTAGLTAADTTTPKALHNGAAPCSTSTRPPPRETSTTWAWASSAEPAMAFPSEATSRPPLTSWPDPALTLPNFTSSAALLSLC